MSTELDPRLKQIANNLDDPQSLASWLLSGGKRIIYDDIVPSQAFRPGKLMIGVNPLLTWNQELALFYRKLLRREQQDWFRVSIARELELINPHDSPIEAEQYVVFLLSMAQTLGIREVTPNILLGLINRRFSQSKEVFGSVLLTWCTLPTGVEFSASSGVSSASETLLDFVLHDIRYTPDKWMMHLLIAITRKNPASLMEHANRFGDVVSLAIIAAQSVQRKRTTLAELERLAAKGMVSWPKLWQTDLLKSFRTNLNEHAEVRQHISLSNFDQLRSTESPAKTRSLRDRRSSNPCEEHRHARRRAIA